MSARTRAPQIHAVGPERDAAPAIDASRTSWTENAGLAPVARAEPASETRTLDAMGGPALAQVPQERPWWAADPTRGIRKRVSETAAGAAGAVREAAARSSMFRVGMDNRFPGPGADTTAFLSEREQAQEYFDARLAAARKFLEERGMDGTIAAKMVTADIVNLAGGSPVEHAEWQLHLVPNAGQEVSGRIDPKNAPGMFDEKRLEEFVKAEGAKSEGSEILRSEDNPLFLGRLNYGTAGSGMYTKVPDYAEVGGHKYDTREVEMMTTTDPESVRQALDAMYSQQSRPYAVDGVCHQGAVLVGQMLGIDPKEVAGRIQSAWATRFKFGRTGRDGK